MKKYLLLIQLLIAFTFVKAQFPGGGNAAPNIGHVYGKIIDSSSGKALDNVSVLLMQNRMDTETKKRKDFLFKGTSTSGIGEFSMNELPVMGTLYLQISAVGYKLIKLPIRFNLSAGINGMDLDLGNIKMQEDSKQLEGVVVVSEKPLMQMDIDKKVFSVDKNLVSSGGTALDVMRNVPSVQVDIEGGLKLRNATPQIYVDGRPSTLTVDQIPADAIESVEVITNPSAKFDASGGGAGIINIVLKKNKKSGYNGSVGIGADSRGGFNGRLNFNLRQDKFNFTASAFGNSIRNKTIGTTERLTLLNTPNIFVNQENENMTKGGFVFGRIGVDYFASNRTTLSLAGIKVRGQFEPNSVVEIMTDSLYPSGKVSSRSNRVSDITSEFDATGLQGGLKYNFTKPGKEITADATYFSSDRTSGNTFTSQYFNPGGSLKNLGRQRQDNVGDNSNLTIQTDYVNPVTDKIKIESGLRLQLNKASNENRNFLQANGTGDFIFIPNAGASYKDENYVYAAYFSLGQSIKNFGYKLGLRAESSQYKGELVSTGEKFGNDYPISLFPSVFLSQKLKNKQELQFSYTRRINRPGFNQLIPFTDYTDTLNITRGNPNLVPSFTNSLEASYTKTFKRNNMFLASIYFKNTNDLLTSFLDRQTNPITGKQDLINTYINANSSYSSGAELTSVNTITKWLDLTSNINVYNSKINTDNVLGFSQDARWSWFGKINTNWKLPKKFTAQLSANYQSKTNLAIGGGERQYGGGGAQSQSASQGYIRSYWSTDLALKKLFLKDKADVTLSVSDIFRTRRIDQRSESVFFIQDYSRLNNPQLVRLTLSYRFGKFDTSLFKRQNRKIQQEGMQGGMDGMQQ